MTAMVITRSAVSSVSGLLGLLEDVDTRVQTSALLGLLSCVDYHWHEIAESLPIIEMLASNRQFPQHKAASLLASRIMFHLESLDEAVKYAMAAEELFIVGGVSLFSKTIIGMAVRLYCTDRLRLFETAMQNVDSTKGRQIANGPSGTIDPRLESLVERMLKDSQLKGKRGQIEALGVAIESRRLDKVKEIIVQSSDPSSLLLYCVERAQTTLKSHSFRHLLLEIIVEIYLTNFSIKERQVLRVEGRAIVHALFLVGDYSKVAEILHDLLIQTDVENDEDDTLMAYQIAFDLIAFENQQFISNLLREQCLQLVTDTASSKSEDLNVPPVTATGISATSIMDGGALTTSPLKDTDQRIAAEPVDDATQPLLAAPVTEIRDEADKVIVENVGKMESPEKLKLGRLREILTGMRSLTLATDFLHRNNHADLNLLDQIKNAVDSRSSITQNAVVISHALMQAGTTCDSFLRENLEWLGKAVCWAKFAAAASNGVLHRGHVQASRQVLSSYLPGSGGGPYSEGGALYGLGIIHANVMDEATKLYLLEQLASAAQTCPQNFEPLQHGACLGLGLMAMGTGDADIYAALRDILFSDSAVAGEAAALAMGLVTLGSGSEAAISELLGYAHDTEHEKIIRSAALGVAVCLYRKEEEADPIIDQMAKDKDHMIRYAAMFGLGLAYCGTSNSSAARRLLHVGVSDLSSDVRRAAVMSLGFVLCDAPSQLPKVVSLLADSFNPHVRYAAALAVGIGCSGTWSQAAVDLLLPMSQDTTDFVRQGALLALGLVLAEASAAALPDNRVQKVRDLFVRIAADKHEDAITRFGAIIAQGLIDAGGRNSTIGFFSITGALRVESAIGFLLFGQLWYWYPLVLGVSLAFRPTALIGLASDLTVPSDFEVVCEALSSQFAYVEPVTKNKKEEKREIVTAVLSAANRRKQREQVKRMATTGTELPKKTEDVEMEKASNEKKPEPIEDKAEIPTAVSMSNPCRVVPGQDSYMRLNDIQSSNWIPIDSNRKTGFVMIKKKRN